MKKKATKRVRFTSGKKGMHELEIAVLETGAIDSIAPYESVKVASKIYGKNGSFIELVQGESHKPLVRS